MAAGSNAPPTGPKPQAVRRLAPKNPSELLGQVQMLHSATSDVATRHQVIGSRWDVVDSWGRLVTALAASLSALTLFADNKAATATFAIAAAVVASLNAAWTPADRAERHRKTYKDYVALERPLAELGFLLHDRTDTLYDPTSGEYYATGMTTAELGDAWEKFQSCNAQLETIMRNAPVLNRVLGGDGTPRTAWGMKRLRKRVGRRQEVEDLYLEAWMHGQAARGATTPPSARC